MEPDRDFRRDTRGQKPLDAAVLIHKRRNRIRSLRRYRRASYTDAGKNKFCDIGLPFAAKDFLPR